MFEYQAKLIEVIDGDTVDLMVDLGFGVHVRERFRLYGVDAPEMPTEAGKIAKAHLQSLVGGTQELYVATIKMVKRPKEKTDKYGRYLAVLYQEPQHFAEDRYEARILMRPASINWRMVEAGHAKEKYSN